MILIILAIALITVYVEVCKLCQEHLLNLYKIELELNTKNSYTVIMKGVLSGNR